MVVINPISETIACRRNAFTDVTDFYKNEAWAKQERRKIHSRHDDIINPPVIVDASPGEQKLRRFDEILENGYPWQRGRFQREFHEHITCAMAPSIVGAADWSRIGQEIARSRGWRTISKMVLGKAPRRFGKSAAVGMVAITRAEVMIVENPLVKQDIQAIFSTGRRASTALGEYCYRFALDRGLGPRVIKYTEETLWIRGGSDLKDPNAPVAKIYFYPSNAKIDYNFGGGGFTLPTPGAFSIRDFSLSLS